MKPVVWKDGGSFSVGDVLFNTVSREEAESAGAIFAMKSHSLLDLYGKQLEEIDPKHIIEVGCLGGGGAVFLNEKFDPKSILMIDIADQTTHGFKKYLNTSQRAKRLRPYLSIDQRDGKKIVELSNKEFGGHRPDLVIDDASHLYEFSRSTFEYLFPIVRPGGLYIIEDWGWANWQGKFWQEDQTDWTFTPALTNLIFELVMAAASRPDLVASLRITYSGCVVERGSDDTVKIGDPIRSYYVSRGKEIVLI